MRAVYNFNFVETMKKNMWVKIFAWVALLGIILSIIWTGILFLYESNTNYSEEVQLTEEQIRELIEAQELSATWSINESDLLEVFDGAEATESIENESEDIIESGENAIEEE